MGRTDTVVYDAKDRPVERRTGGLAAVQTTYDSHGQVQTVRQAGRTLRFDYDSLGQLALATDPLQRMIGFVYDSAGRLTRIRAADGAEARYGYDPNGNLTSITPPGRPAHTFSYNAHGLVETYTAPRVGDTSTVTSYGYDKDNLIKAIARPGGDSITFQYDSAGRAIGIRHKDGVLSFGYAPTTGLLTTSSVGGEGGSVTMSYNGARLTSVTSSGVASGTATLSYDVNFRLNGITIGNQLVSVGYDKDGLLDSAGALGVKRDPASGLVTGTTLGSVVTRAGIDTLGVRTSDTTIANGSVIFAYRLERDSVERVVQRIESFQGVDVTYHYTYDLAGHLHEVERDGQLIATYEYDQNGNRQSYTSSAGQVSAQYDAQDRLLQYGDLTFGYTRAGERSFRALGNDTTRYQYDALGALRSVVLPDGKRIDYVVDALGRRVAKKVNGVITRRYLYVGTLGTSAELNASGQVMSRYVYGLQRNAPDYMIRGGVSYRLVKDERGSVRAVVDVSSDTIVQRIDYDEFGRTLLNTNPGFQPFGFAGGLTDEDQPLIRFGARDYDPETGTWTTKDPVGLGAGNSLYAYVDGDPINYSDPYGLGGIVITIPLIGEGAEALGALGGILSGPPGWVAIGVLSIAMADHALHPASDFLATPSARAAADATSGIWARGPNKLAPDDSAQGPHTTFEPAAPGAPVKKWQDWLPNPHRPPDAPWDPGPRYDGDPNGGPHFDKKTQKWIPTPHINLPDGGVRPAEPHEIPKPCGS
jgi:RHS repeat-associated protein